MLKKIKANYAYQLRSILFGTAVSAGQCPKRVVAFFGIDIGLRTLIQAEMDSGKEEIKSNVTWLGDGGEPNASLRTEGLDAPIRVLFSSPISHEDAHDVRRERRPHCR